MGFRADFHFWQDRANFWQTDLFWHETHSSVIILSWSICTWFSRNNVCKKLSFVWSGIFTSKSFEGRFRCDMNLNGYFWQLWQHIYFEKDVLVCEVSKETDQKKKRPTLHRPMSQQNKFTSTPFSALIACTNEAAVTD